MSSIANIHPKAIIGSNTVIEPFATIGEDVEIGDNCWIGPNAVLMSGTRVGNNCKVFPGAVIGAIPQDLKYKGENTHVFIGDNTTIREHVTINKGTADKNKTSTVYWLTQDSNQQARKLYDNIGSVTSFIKYNRH